MQLGSGYTAEGMFCLGADKHWLDGSHILRLFQGHFVLYCFLLLLLRKNIPNLHGESLQV